MTQLTPDVQYQMLLFMAIVFTVLSMVLSEVDWKHITLQWFASFTWICSAFANMAMGESNTFLTLMLTYLYAAFGLIFSIAALFNASMKMKGGF